MRDGSVSDDKNIVLSTWKDSFCNMLNQKYSDFSNDFDSTVEMMIFLTILLLQMRFLIF